MAFNRHGIGMAMLMGIDHWGSTPIGGFGPHMQTLAHTGHNVCVPLTQPHSTPTHMHTHARETLASTRACERATAHTCIQPHKCHQRMHEHGTA